jgi:hypothetical protein
MLFQAEEEKKECNVEYAAGKLLKLTTANSIEEPIGISLRTTVLGMRPLGSHGKSI